MTRTALLFTLTAFAVIPAALRADMLGGPLPIARPSRAYGALAGGAGHTDWRSPNYTEIQVPTQTAPEQSITYSCDRGNANFPDCDSRSGFSRWSLEGGFAINNFWELYGRLGASSFTVEPSVNNTSRNGNAPDTRFGFTPFLLVGARGALWQHGPWSVGVIGQYGYTASHGTTTADYRPNSNDNPYYYGYLHKVELSRQYQATLAAALQWNIDRFAIYGGPLWSRQQARLTFKNIATGNPEFQYDLRENKRIGGYLGARVDFRNSWLLSFEAQSRSGTQGEIALIYQY